MKYLLVISFVLFISVLSSAGMRCPGNSKVTTFNKALQDIQQHLKKKASPKAVPAKDLAPAILRAALKYGIDYHLLTAVVLVESRGVEKAFNKRTRDYGIGQINIHTARSMGLSMTCLMNYRCNLDATAKIISTINDGNICVYNLGTRKLVGQRAFLCEKYERKIALMQ